jgi:hypothetical protein
MGVAQHHDAITGTEKQEVAFDYAQRLSDGIDIAQVCSNNRIFLQFRNILCTVKHRRLINVQMKGDSLFRSTNFTYTLFKTFHSVSFLFRMSSIKLILSFYLKLVNHRHLNFFVNYQILVNVLKSMDKNE